jgi:hypothetical protein
MKPETTLTVAADKPALILYWPVANGGLWDPDVSAMVERLEDELEVFATCVGSGRGALGLSDAAAAARFMGCSSLVVVSLEGDAPEWREIEDASVGFRLTTVSIGSDPTPPAVVAAYREACRHAQRAA